MYWIPIILETEVRLEYSLPWVTLWTDGNCWLMTFETSISQGKQ